MENFQGKRKPGQEICIRGFDDESRIRQFKRFQAHFRTKGPSPEALTLEERLSLLFLLLSGVTSFLYPAQLQRKQLGLKSPLLFCLHFSLRI